MEIDWLFQKKCPLVFAHRGGMFENPESTERAFSRALDGGSDVLEIDIRTTKNGVFVVWHGPQLDNVRIEGVSDSIFRRSKSQNDIRRFDWQNLDGRSWVNDAPEAQSEGDSIGLKKLFKYLIPRFILKLITDGPDVSNVPKEPDRTLLSLDQFLEIFPEADLNIEVKGSPENAEIQDLINILERKSAKRKIVFALGNPFILKRFRQLNTYPTSFSIIGSLLFKVPGVLYLAPRLVSFERRAFQTSHRFLTAGVVKRMQKLNVPVHVFITTFFGLKGLDAATSGPDREALFKILDLGVDGIMTDRPKRVVTMVKDWLMRQPADNPG